MSSAMLRAWIFLIFILLCGLACTAMLQTGNSIYLFYALLLVPVVAIINAARPRHGVRFYLKMQDPIQDGRSLRLKYRSTIMELFKSLSVFREASVAWSKPAIDFLVLEEEWGWWRARKAIAEKLGKELSG